MTAAPMTTVFGRTPTAARTASLAVSIDLIGLLVPEKSDHCEVPDRVVLLFAA